MMIPQREPYDQASGCSPSVDDPMTTDTPLDTGGEQQDPSHQRRHDVSPQDEDAPCRHHNLYFPPRSDICGRGNEGIWQ